MEREKAQMYGKEKYPKFKRLMTMLKSRLAADGSSLSVANDLHEAREGLQETKRELFENELIFGELHDILLELNHKRSIQTATSDEEEARNMLQEALRNSEAKKYLQISNADENPIDSNLFGLTEDKFEYKESKRKHIQQTLQQYFVPDMEQRLKKRCIDLMKLWDNRTEGESDGLTLAKSAKLPYFIESEIQKIEGERSKLKEEEQNYRELLLDYQKLVKDYMDNLEKFLEKHPLDSQIEKTKTTVEWLEAKCEALQLKIKVLQRQLFKDTYDKDSVAALATVREHLDKAMLESRGELARMERTLKAYESVGNGFDSLVREYARLTAEIDNRRWALAELKRSQET